MHKKYLEQSPEEQQTVGEPITWTATGGRRIKDILATTVQALELYLGVSQWTFPVIPAYWCPNPAVWPV